MFPCCLEFSYHRCFDMQPFLHRTITRVSSKNPIFCRRTASFGPRNLLLRYARLSGLNPKIIFSSANRFALLPKSPAFRPHRLQRVLSTRYSGAGIYLTLSGFSRKEIRQEIFLSCPAIELKFYFAVGESSYRLPQHLGKKRSIRKKTDYIHAKSESKNAKEEYCAARRGRKRSARKASRYFADFPFW